MAFRAGHFAGAAKMWGEINAGIFWYVAVAAFLTFVFAGFGFDFDTKTGTDED